MCREESRVEYTYKSATGFRGGRLRFWRGIDEREGCKWNSPLKHVTMPRGGKACHILRLEFFVLLGLLGCSNGYLNLFISESQVKKYFGELYQIKKKTYNVQLSTPK